MVGVAGHHRDERRHDGGRYVEAPRVVAEHPQLVDARQDDGGIDSGGLRAGGLHYPQLRDDLNRGGDAPGVRTAG